MKKGVPNLVVLLSLVISMYLLTLWLPQQVSVFRGRLDAKAGKQIPTMLHGSLGPSGKSLLSQAGADETKNTLTGLPKELIDYIASQKKTDASFSDSLDEDELVETFESFQQDYALRADDMFKRFEKEYLPVDPEEIEAYGFLNTDGKDAPVLSYSSADFTAPPGLESIVMFWEKIFGVYDKNVAVFHHPRNVGIVYSVLDFRELAKESSPDFDEIKAGAIRDEKNRLQNLLQALAKKMSETNIDVATLSLEETRLLELFEQSPEITINSLSGAGGLKVTMGYAHRFKQAIAKSGQYMPEMMRIFRKYGLPLELTCIPFVESSFNEEAASHAGAAGVWQFIPETGRRYLKIDDYVDERFDPIMSTHAAAKHLMNEFKLLRSWPLAINAYNTGPGRILDAIKVLGTKDIAMINRQYEGSGYGYDSRNYFAELLAAIKVYRNYKNYFGEVNFLPEQTHEYIVMPAPTNIKQLFRLSGVSPAAMQDLNLMLHPSVISGEKNLPKGYLVKVMPGAREDMLMAAHDLYRQTKNAAYHLVMKGETLADIAELYDMDPDDLADANALDDDAVVTAGTLLKIPGNNEQALVRPNMNDPFMQQSKIKGSGAVFKDGVESVIEDDMNSTTSDDENDFDEETLEEGRQLTDTIF